MRRAAAGLRLALCGIACGAAGGTAAPAASAQSFERLTIDVSVAPVARFGGPMPIAVSVSADPGVLDAATPLRVRAKLAAECGGTFTYTAGTVVLDARLKPQPDPAEPYQASISGRGRPTAYGGQTLCVYLEEEGDGRQFATDTSNQVDVSRPCTVAAARYDGAVAAAASTRTALRHAHGAARTRLQRLLTKQLAAASTAGHHARAACGPGVPL